MPVSYQSTRGGSTGVLFRDAILSGLCDDGGLFVPSSIPKFDAAELKELSTLPFASLAFRVMRPFITPEDISDDDLRGILERTYTFEFDSCRFRSPSVVEMEDVGDVKVLELFHGPTFAFKDVALQFLGNLFEHYMTGDATEQSSMTVVGATSGDTGSAALHGLRGKKGVEAFILFPKGRVSEVQQRQMTTILDDNVHCIAVEGTFDDCQDAVKSMFRDLDIKRKLSLAAVNSINWARILAQIVYYFRAYFLAVEGAGDAGDEVVFSVPTGNFGNILAGWYAQRMGLPVRKLVLATNENDILHRFFSTGVYEKLGVRPTMAPSMDIQVASNFERFIFHIVGESSEVVNSLMADFAKTSKFTLDGDRLEAARSYITTERVSEADAAGTILSLHKENDYLACPHSAIGICAAKRYVENNRGNSDKSDAHVIALATAHAGKFGDAVKRSIGGGAEAEAAFSLPKELSSLLSLETRVVELPNDFSVISSVISSVTLREEGCEGYLGDIKFFIRVPASSANLGPGYDALGLAVGMHLQIDVTRRAADDGCGVTMEMTGEGSGKAGASSGNETVPLNSDNLIIRAAVATARAAKGDDAELPGCDLKIRNAIPLGRGLGSSSAAIVAGVMLADKLFHLNMSRDAIFQQAAEIEGHPDNVCAAVYGGLQACMSGVGSRGEGEEGKDGKKILYASIPAAVDHSIKLVVAVPGYQVATADARAALPANYSSEDVVHNLQRSSALIGILGNLSKGKDEQERAKWIGYIRDALCDKLHESQRSHLLPGFPEAKAAAYKVEGCIGSCLSGAGPTVLALATSSFEDIGTAMVNAFKAKDTTATFKVLDVDANGAHYC